MARGKKKLYAYVDESGQDTKGELFVVGVVVTEGEWQTFAQELEEVERSTGKGKQKWNGTEHERRLAYIKRVLSKEIFKGKLHYAHFEQTKEYLSNTVLATARAVTLCAGGDYEVTVSVDGLPKSQVRYFGTTLRQLHIRTRKVRGVRREENDALVRLAGAVSWCAAKGSSLKSQ